MPSICYVVPTWSGPRRWNHPSFLRSNDFYLREQIEHLKQRHTHIRHVAVMVPHNAHEAPEFTEALEEFAATDFRWVNTEEKKFGIDRPEAERITVEVVRRPNVGMSYGSLADAFERYGCEYDYYLFQEDDVFYGLDNFDQVWLRLMQGAGDRCGFACARIAGPEYGVGAPLHAGIGCGLLRAEALKWVVNGLGRLPHATVAHYGATEVDGQIALSQAILKHNWFMHDLRGTQYGAGFRHPSGALSYWNMEGPNQRQLVWPM